jgi:hypothetical protein
LGELAFVAQSVGDPLLIDSEIQFAASELHLIDSEIQFAASELHLIDSELSLCSLPGLKIVVLSLCSLPGLNIVVLGLCSLPHLMDFEKQFATHSMAESHCFVD